MGDLVSYRIDDGIACITMDDGKANALSLRMLTEVGAAFDRAAADNAVVVLTGREGRFSAGFDLGVLSTGGSEAVAMLRAGFDLAERILSFPRPVVVACNGHAVAMGVFLLLAGDYRVGTSGPYRIAANEVAIGITMPRAAVEICRLRLTPAHFNQAVLLAEPFSPDEAVTAGFLDCVVPADELHDAAHTTATRLAALDMTAHANTKLRAREDVLAALRAGIEADHADNMALFASA